MRIMLLIAVTILAVTGVAGQQPSAAISSNPAVRVFDAWLTAFNTGQPPTILSFDADNRATPMSINQTMFLRATTGGFTLIRVDRIEQSAISALVQEKFSEQFHRVDMALDPTTSRIVRQDVRPVERPPDLLIPRMTESGAIAALVERANASASAGEFSGVLLVAHNDRILLERAWGVANRETQVPVTTATQFEIASTAKMFQAVAALQLVEAGRLRLDGVVGTYIPEYANKEIASKVTIRHLLMHTGGTGGVPPADVRKTLRTAGDYVRVLADRAPLFEPGTEYLYSNYGYILLSAIVERVTGTSFPEYAQRRIFEPAGMRSTTLGLPKQVDPRRALGYVKQETRWMRASTDDPSVSTEPLSTARDLLSFARALDSGELISKTLLAEAASPPVGRRYGYGLLVMEHGRIRSYGHGGTGAGVNSEVRIIPSLGYVVIGLANAPQPAASRLVDFLLNRMPAA
jgi:CubicO group peptidase (beta-lactamase class C family)